MPTPTCSSCVFWEIRPEYPRTPNGDRPGSCRRHSPKTFQSGATAKLFTRWPITGEKDFCGDHATAMAGAGFTRTVGYP